LHRFLWERVRSV